MASEENIAIARTLARRFGGKPEVREYLDTGEKNSIDILTCPDTPDDELNSYATLGLSEQPTLDADGNALDFGVELIAAFEAEAGEAAAMLSTCAFTIRNELMPAYPGAVLPDILDLHEGLSSTLSHVFLTDPFVWDEAMESISLATRTVAFLQVIPISDSEYAYWQENGAEALVDAFLQNQIDVYDLDRSPVA